MKNLLRKELKLATSPITWFFLAFTFMTFLPGYPILIGSFFVCQGLFQSFQLAREANDTIYTALLPVRKTDYVAAKYLVVCFFELIAFCLMFVFTMIRMTVLSGGMPYVKNALMNATPVFLAFVLIIFLLFNLIFVGGFFRTAYKAGKPYIIFIAVTLVVVFAAEVLHHLPGLAFLNDPAGARLPLQWGILGAAAALYAAGTLISERISEKRFERIDL